MHVDVIPEYEILESTHEAICGLLAKSFTDYPPERSYYKLLPQFRYLAWIDDTLVAQVGIEHRVIVNTGVPAQIFGLIDLCVVKSYRRQKIATILLQQIETLAKASSIDFLVLFADDARLYFQNGYERVDNCCRWMKVDEHQTLGIGEASMSDCMMIKPVGEQRWLSGTVDLLGYLF